MILNTRLSDAEERGIKQGLTQGINQGITQGIEKANIEIAKKMLVEQADIHMISRVTGLDIEKIKNLNN